MLKRRFATRSLRASLCRVLHERNACRRARLRRSTAEGSPHGPPGVAGQINQPSSDANVSASAGPEVPACLLRRNRACLITFAAEAQVVAQCDAIRGVAVCTRVDDVICEAVSLSRSSKCQVPWKMNYVLSAVIVVAQTSMVLDIATSGRERELREEDVVPVGTRRKRAA